MPSRLSLRPYLRSIMNKKDYMYQGIEPAAAAYFLSLSQTSLEMSKRTFLQKRSILIKCIILLLIAHQDKNVAKSVNTKMYSSSVRKSEFSTQPRIFCPDLMIRNVL